MFYSLKYTRLLMRSRCTSIPMNFTHNSTIATDVFFIKVKDQDTGDIREIACRKYEGSKEHQIMYIPGFMSSMSGVKASSLDLFCRRNNFTYTRYDPTGLGDSKPIPLHQARLTHWIQDAENILNMIEEPQVVVASSMGGWIAAALCLKYPIKFRSLVFLAPGINFTKRYFDKMSTILPRPVTERLEKGETIIFEHPEYGRLPVSYALSDNFYENELNLSQGLNINCPVRIIHGTLDDDVPYEESMKLMHQLKSSDVQLTFIKDAHHRLSTNSDLELIFDVILRLISKKET